MADLKGRVESGNEDHQEVLELLPWYLNGTLGDDERATVDLHLRECASCQFELEELQGLQSALLAEELDLEEIFLQDTMDEIRSRPKEAAKIEPKRESKPEKRRKQKPFILRPRLAFTFSAIVIFFIVGIILGGFFFTGITDNPGTNVTSSETDGTVNQGQTDSQFRTDGQVVFFETDFRDQGTFKTRVGNVEKSLEKFSFEGQSAGSFTLNSTIDEIGGEGKSAGHNLSLSSDFLPIQYRLVGNVVYEGNRAEAVVLEDHALLTKSAVDGTYKRRAELYSQPVILDFSVMSHFYVLHEAIKLQANAGVSYEAMSFTVLTPQVLLAEQMTIVAVESAFLNRAENESVPVTRYVLRQGAEANALEIHLYATQSGEELIAIHFPRQDRIAASTGVFSFRSDLYEDLLNPSSR